MKQRTPPPRLLLPEGADEDAVLVPPDDEAYTPTDLRRELRQHLANLEQASVGKLALKSIQQANFLREVLATILAGKRGLEKLGLLKLKPLGKRQQLGVRYALHQAIEHAPELVVCDHPGLRKERKGEREKKLARASEEQGGPARLPKATPCPSCGLLVKGWVLRAAIKRLIQRKNFLTGKTQEVTRLLADYNEVKKGRK